MCRLSVLLTILITLMFVANPAWAQTAYVTDSIKITMRTGPSTSKKILRMLPTGTPLQILDQTKNWYKVKTRDNQEGWVLKRYTMQSLPKQSVIEDLRQKLSQATTSNDEYKETIARLKSENQELENSLAELEKKHSELKNRYAELKNDAQQALTYKENYQTTREKLDQTNSKLASLQGKYENLRSSHQRQWFITGAGVVFISALLGFIFGRMQRRKPSKYRF